MHHVWGASTHSHRYRIYSFSFPRLPSSYCFLPLKSRRIVAPLPSTAISIPTLLLDLLTASLPSSRSHDCTWFSQLECTWFDVQLFSIQTPFGRVNEYACFFMFFTDLLFNRLLVSVLSPSFDMQLYKRGNRTPLPPSLVDPFRSLFSFQGTMLCGPFCLFVFPLNYLLWGKKEKKSASPQPLPSNHHHQHHTITTTHHHQQQNHHFTSTNTSSPATPRLYHHYSVATNTFIPP